MSANAGRQLLDVLQRELLSALRDAVSEAVAGRADIAVDPTFDGTAFAGKVLAPVDVDNPVFTALSRLTSADAAGTSARLRFWRDEPVDGAPLGVAYVVSSGSTAVVALAIVPDAGAQLVVRAAGFAAGQSVQVPLAADFALRISATTTADGIAVAFPVDQPPQVLTLAAGDRVDIDVTRPTTGELLGVPGGPSVLFGAVSAGGFVANSAANPFERGAHLRLEGGQVALVPGFVRSVIPVDLTFPLDLDLRAAPDVGVALAGSPSLRTRLTGAPTGRWLDLVVGLVDNVGSSALDISFLTTVDISLPGLPLRMHVDGIGLRMPISLRLGAPMLPNVASLASLEPEGVAVALDLPVLSGSGALARIGDDLAGALAVKIPPMSASAFGVLTPPRDGQPLSFLVIMGATFPPPGVQIGFGFAISGIGGVVGINRRIDRDALLRAVTDGTAAQLLFPSDPVGAGRAAIEALPRVFPAARGCVVAGPMLQLSWGGRLVTMSVAVLVESSTQVRLTIMGKLVVAVPDPEAPLVFLQATFAGFIDPAEPSAMFVASLAGSHIVGAPLSGDLLLLTRGGSDPTFVLSAGGFHPSYRVPRGVPSLRRLSLDLCPAPWIDLRCENYFAVTSNTLQLGARLELVAEVAGCGLRGWLAFDALVQYSPFRFIADVSAGIALRVFGETLVGISLALHLEGPAPYLARGRGSIDLFLFEVSFDFEVGWGSPAAALDPPFDIGTALRTALAAPTAWRPRGATPAGLVVTGAAQRLLSEAALVDAYGAISVRQERVPLGIEIQRVNGIAVAAQRWDITAGQFGPDEPAERVVDVRSEFAPGQFLASRNDDEALSAPAFASLKSGVELSPATAAGAEARPAGLTWEERVIARDIPVPVPAPVGLLVDIGLLHTMITALSVTDRGWWVVPQDVVTVDPVAPVAAAFAWSMAPATGFDAPTGLEMGQALHGAAELMTVEAWEVTV